MSNRLTTEEFVKRAKKAHGNKFDYCRVNYINRREKVEVRCKEHNKWFNIEPEYHLKGSVGCPDCKYHVGETRIANNGQKMTIIAAKNSYDINIRFEDGTEVYNKKYEDFSKGCIGNPNFKSVSSVSLPEIALLYYLSRYGFKKAEKGTIKCLNGMELDLYCSDVNGHKVAIEFDGYAWHRKKDAIKRDIEKNKRCKEGDIFLYRVREKGLKDISDENIKCFFVPKIVSSRKNSVLRLKSVACELINDINMRFGTPFFITFSCDDDIKVPEMLNNYYNLQREQRIGETRMMNNGMEAKIINYRSADSIDVEFPDGEVREGVRYDHFCSGHISHPTVNTINILKKEEYLNKEFNSPVYGTIKVVRYESAFDMDIECSNGEKFYNANFDKLRNLLKKTETERIQLMTERIGESKVMNNGMLATIIEYKANSNIDVQFPDGAIAYNKSYRSFRDGIIAHPSQAHEAKKIKISYDDFEQTFPSKVACAEYLNVPYTSLCRYIKAGTYDKYTLSIVA